MKILKFLEKYKIVLFLILIVSAFYRLFRIQDYMTFLGDEGRDVLVAYNILHGHLTLLGPTSSVGGFFLGPIYYYFMAPWLLLFNYNPVGPAVGVALVGIATVYLLYRICSEFFNKRVAFFASLIYAIAPLVVAYSRSSWNPNPLPFVSLLILYLLYRSNQKNTLKIIFGAGFLFGIAMQLHYLALFLGVIIFAYITFTTLYKNFKNSLLLLLRKYLSFALGFVIGWSPFIAFEVRHGFPDFKNITDFVLHSGNTGPGSSFLTTVSDVYFRFFGRLVFDFPPPEQLHWYMQPAVAIWTIFILVFAIGSSLFLFFKFYKSLKNKDENFYKFTLLTFWLVIGILLFGFYKKAIYDYYLAILFPLPFILVSLLLDEIFQNKKYVKNISKYLASILFIIIIILNLVGIPFRYPANRQLNQMKSIAEFVMTKTNAQPFNFALISGGNSDYAYRYFFTIWNHPPVTIQDFAHDPDRKTTTNQLFVVCESPIPCQPLGNSLWEIAGFGRADIEGEWNVSVVQVYKLVHYKGK